MSDSEKEIYDAMSLTDTDEGNGQEEEGNEKAQGEIMAEKAEAISEKIADTDDVLSNAKKMSDTEKNEEIKIPEEETLENLPEQVSNGE